MQRRVAQRPQDVRGGLGHHREQDVDVLAREVHGARDGDRAVPGAEEGDEQPVTSKVTPAVAAWVRHGFGSPPQDRHRGALRGA